MPGAMLMAPLLAAGAIWSGTARVDVMIWEPGGQHPYTTDFDLQYSVLPPSGLEPAR